MLVNRPRAIAIEREIFHRLQVDGVEAGKKLGYSSLREKQIQIVKHLLSEQDVFVSLPTGSGKSLCYCVLPYAFDALPEALLTNETWRDMLLSAVYQENLMALVVDEAHCVKKW